MIFCGGQTVHNFGRTHTVACNQPFKGRYIEWLKYYGENMEICGSWWFIYFMLMFIMIRLHEIHRLMNMSWLFVINLEFDIFSSKFKKMPSLSKQLTFNSDVFSNFNKPFW
jgi:hypothetical protein